MRNLQFEQPPMTGTDVLDWQKFLATQRFLSAMPDGVFDPATANATRAYQAKRGLSSDGVVGPATLAKALADGLTSGTRPFASGMDASVGCSPFASRIASEGMKFVARYYSNTASKNLTLAEAHTLSAAGLQLLTVYEDANDNLASFTVAKGTGQAAKALQLAATINQPAGSAIYFAVDFDPQPNDIRGPVMQYFQAVHQVFSAAPTQFTIGVYGSGLTCRLIRDAGFARFTWLSCSTGFQESNQFRPQANIVQSVPRPLFEGLEIDDDIAQTTEFGAFRL